MANVAAEYIPRGVPGNTTPESAKGTPFTLHHASADPSGEQVNANEGHPAAFPEPASPANYGDATQAAGLSRSSHDEAGS